MLEQAAKELAHDPLPRIQNPKKGQRTEGPREMIDRCFNPACGRELRYLRDGRVVRVIYESRDDVLIEHFWLCGDCYKTHDFAFPAGEKVALVARARQDIDAPLLTDVLVAS